jgi:3-phosphoshikimate 1-carboxyvinyltransferase
MTTAGPTRTLDVVGGRALRGSLRVPGDKSISHRALLIAALADGTSTITGLSTGDDVHRTRLAVEALGATIAEDGDGALRVDGGALHEPSAVVDIGNSGTGIRLLAGVCAGLPFLTVLEGDASIAQRPMDRVAEPLRSMGARIDGREQGRFPPLVVRGGDLHAIDYALPVPSAQVKSAILFAGLAAEGTTIVREELVSRAHTEEMLAQAGADIERGDGSGVVRLRPSTLSPSEFAVPGDPSQAAFWIVAACLVPGSEITVEDVYVGPGRNGFLDVLERMGADLQVHAQVHERTGAATATIIARSSELHGCVVEPGEIPGLVDEIPVLAVAAARAAGETRFQGVGELRVKESDRLATISSELERFTGKVEATADELVVHGGERLVGAEVTSHGDHRIAMAMAIAALAADDASTIDDWDAVATSYPTFEGDLAFLQDSTELPAGTDLPGNTARGRH